MRFCLLALAAFLPALAAPNRAGVVDAFGKLPVTFEENRGQTAAQVKFFSSAGRFNLFLTETDAVLSVPSTGNSIRMRLEGAGKPEAIQGLDRQAGTSNYFVGNDPKKWRTKVPHFSRVIYRKVYPGVDLVYRGSHRQLEYDFELQPGTDASQIVLGFQGVDGLKLDSNGDLILKSADGELREHRPVAYQETEGGRRSVDVEYRILANHRVGFRLGDYDQDDPLTIDPILSYSTYLGGSGSVCIYCIDAATGMAVDGAGNAYLTGTTPSPNFPTTPGAYNTTFPAASGYAFFVAKLSSDGTQLLYSTFLGSPVTNLRGVAGRTAIAVDGSGNAYIAGDYVAPGFPTTPGAYSTDPNKSSSFVAKLNSTGTQLVYSTYLNSVGGTHPGAVAVDGSGNAYLSGSTQDPNFPTTPGAFQTTFQLNNAQQGTHAFVTKLNAGGTGLIYSTFLGGNGADFGAALAIDASGNAYVAGGTISGQDPNTFPSTSGVYQPGVNGPEDGFVAKLNATGKALLFSTFLGGGSYDALSALALDTQGNIFVVGGTTSTDFPTTPGAYQTLPNGSSAFLTKLKADATSLLYSTYLGCSSTRAFGVAVDSGGNAYVVGHTSCSSFPVTPDAFQLNYEGLGTLSLGDAFILELDPTGSFARFSTFLGGTVDEAAIGVALDASGNVYVAGNTSSPNFLTTPGVIEPDLAGPQNIFAVKINPFAANTCTYAVAPGGQTFDSHSATGSFAISAPAGCPWVVINWPPGGFVTSVSGARGSGNGTYKFSIPVNNSSSGRVANLMVEGHNFTVTQNQPCSYGISPNNQSFSLDGGRSSVMVNTQAGCVWLATPNVPWISNVTSSGVGSGPAFYTVAPNTGAARMGTVTIAGQTLTINEAAGPADTTPPFGSFDTPGDNSNNVVGAVPVTGWALDNVGVAKVEIYRDAMSGEAKGNFGYVFIGTAVFIAGARPDVQALYPNLPNANRAGWGYQLLTNFLPGSGNGTFKLHAIAYDGSNNTVEIGTGKTIVCTNATATKPFGTIDTPGQGETISGNNYVNFGWALTPGQAFMIPVNGSTITVVIDGVLLGHPTYGQFRSDIATLFPGYTNSQGAVGFFFLDTTKLTNGVHAISWNVFDNANRGEGLGSRYFTVANGGTQNVPAVEDVPIENLRLELPTDEDGVYSVDVEEMERIELNVGATAGHSLLNGETEALPVGSTLKRGVFYWQLGPGFLGEHRLVLTRPDGQEVQVRVRIRPKTFAPLSEPRP